MPKRSRSASLDRSSNHTPDDDNKRLKESLSEEDEPVLGVEPTIEDMARSSFKVTLPTTAEIKEHEECGNIDGVVVEYSNEGGVVAYSSTTNNHLHKVESPVPPVLKREPACGSEGADNVWPVPSVVVCVDDNTTHPSIPAEGVASGETVVSTAAAVDVPLQQQPSIEEGKDEEDDDYKLPFCRLIKPGLPVIVIGILQAVTPALIARFNLFVEKHKDDHSIITFISGTKKNLWQYGGWIHNNCIEVSAPFTCSPNSRDDMQKLLNEEQQTGMFASLERSFGRPVLRPRLHKLNEDDLNVIDKMVIEIAREESEARGTMRCKSSLNAYLDNYTVFLSTRHDFNGLQTYRVSHFPGDHTDEWICDPECVLKTCFHYQLSDKSLAVIVEEHRQAIDTLLRTFSVDHPVANYRNAIAIVERAKKEYNKFDFYAMSDTAIDGVAGVAKIFELLNDEDPNCYHVRRVDFSLPCGAEFDNIERALPKTAQGTIRVFRDPEQHNGADVLAWNT